MDEKNNNDELHKKTDENKQSNLNDEIAGESKEIIKEFVSEAYTLLEEAEKVVEQLKSKDNQNAVNVTFRLFHSLKGSASFLSFNNIKKITHSAENMLDLLRKKEIVLRHKDIGLIYDTINFLEQLINHVNTHYDDSGYEKEADIIVDKIRSSINQNIEDKRLREKDFSKYLNQSKNLIEILEDTLYQLTKLGYKRELIFDILNHFYTLKMSLRILNYDDLWKVTSELINFLNSLLSEDVKLDSEELNNEFREILDVIKEKLHTFGEDPEHKPEIPNKEEILDKIKFLMGEDISPLRPIGEILVDMGVLDNQTVEEALRLQKMKASDNNYINEISKMYKTKKEDIRVDTKKLDLLFDFVGELSTTAESLISYNNENLKKTRNVKFKKLATNHTRVISNILSLVMSIRMISLESLFIKMKRLVNQLSRRADKKISIEITGESTEIDKNLIEEISDPLVHMIRNAIDHGIETKEERIKKNKPEVGKLSLKAKNEGNEIWITVSDDGKGLDREKIIKKAVKKGLVKQSEIDKLSDRDITKLIFEPGFSTSENVSEISGRGVGMDVVRRNIEKIGGNVDVYTKEDNGTTFIMKIPLTVEIMEVMTLTIGNVKYSIPITDIIETLSLKRNKIDIGDDTKILKLRDEILPLLRLSENKCYTDKSAVVVLKKKDKKVCIVADDIEGIHQTVIKAVPEYFGKLDTIMGSSILGSGDITFIIDTTALINRFLD